MLVLVLSGAQSLAETRSDLRMSFRPRGYLEKGFRNVPWKRDPFFPTSRKFHLSAVISYESAYVNGRWVKKGDTINGFYVKGISSNKVTLVRRQKTIVLTL